MYAKIFVKIFDSSISNNWNARVVFQDLLILADRDGTVDMTFEAISRRTNCPMDFLRSGIAVLQEADEASRTPDDDGRRIERIDQHREWGWRIINYAKYRGLKSSDQLRQANAKRVAKHRDKQAPPLAAAKPAAIPAKPAPPSPTPPTTNTKAEAEADVTLGNAVMGCNGFKSITSETAALSFFIPEELRCDKNFVHHWLEWETHYKEKTGRELSAPTRRIMMQRCLQQGADRAVMVIVASIEKGARELYWDFDTHGVPKTKKIVNDEELHRTKHPKHGW